MQHLNEGNATDAEQLSTLVIEVGCYKLSYNQEEGTTESSPLFYGGHLEEKGQPIKKRVDYYPFGMESKTYTRTAADPTKYLYNAGAEKNPHSGYYETFFRNYDASIGRFNGVDIMANKYRSQTPYNYAFNDPVLLNDPMGADPYGDCDVCNPDNSTYTDRFMAGGNYYASGVEDEYLTNPNAYANWFGNRMDEAAMRNDFRIAQNAGAEGLAGAMALFGSQYTDGFLVELWTEWTVNGERVDDTFAGFSVRGATEAINSQQNQNGGRLFENEGDAYRFMWNSSFDADGNPIREVAGFLTPEGVLVQPLGN